MLSEKNPYQTVSKDEKGRVHISLSNVHPGKEMKLTVELNGATFKKVNSAQMLTAPIYNMVNTFDKPKSVKPVVFKGYKTLGSSALEIAIPALSVVTLELE